MSVEPTTDERLTRRRFWRRSGAKLGALATLAAGASYPVLETKWIRVARHFITLPTLPPRFRGTTLVLLADLHHGPFVPLSHIRRAVDWTNNLKPDLILLCGDYVSKSARYIAPVCGELKRLEARMGRFAVLGNHDHWEGAGESRIELDRAGVELVDNRGVWLRQGSSRLRLCGVGDLWTDHQNLAAALDEAHEDDAVILLSHNPDYAEYLDDDRVGLMLSGHTHGGQIIVPGYGAPVVPSRFGSKYLGGLVQGPKCPVLVSRGVGTSGPPVRLFCRPQIVLVTLV